MCRKKTRASRVYYLGFSYKQGYSAHLLKRSCDESVLSAATWTVNIVQKWSRAPHPEKIRCNALSASRGDKHFQKHEKDASFHTLKNHVMRRKKLEPDARFNQRKARKLAPTSWKDSETKEIACSQLQGCIASGKSKDKGFKRFTSWKDQMHSRTRAQLHITSSKSTRRIQS